MHSKKQAIGIYQTVGLQLMQLHEDDLRALAERTGTIYLPSLDLSIPKRLYRHVRRSRSIEDAIEPAMLDEASGIRASNEPPLRAVMLFRQALSTLMELTTSKFGEKDRVEAIAREIDNNMPALLGLSQ